MRALSTTLNWTANCVTTGRYRAALALVREAKTRPGQRIFLTEKGGVNAQAGVYPVLWRMRKVLDIEEIKIGQVAFFSVAKDLKKLQAVYDINCEQPKLINLGWKAQRAHEKNSMGVSLRSAWFVRSFIKATLFAGASCLIDYLSDNSYLDLLCCFGVFGAIGLPIISLNPSQTAKFHGAKLENQLRAVIDPSRWR